MYNNLIVISNQQNERRHEHLCDLVFTCFTFVVSKPPDSQTSKILEVALAQCMIPQLANMARGRHSHQTVLAALQLLPSQEFAACNGHVFRNRERFAFWRHKLVLICIFAHVGVFIFSQYVLCVPINTAHVYNIHDAGNEQIKNHIIKINIEVSK